MEDIEEASMKVMAGPEKKSRVVTPEEKKLTAYHEAGHAVAGFYCKHHPRVHEITIIPAVRPRLHHVPARKGSQLCDQGRDVRGTRVHLGGRVAEQLILEDISTGASNDLQQATNIARQMITKYGFSERLGPVVYGTSQEETFLAVTWARARVTVRPPLRDRRRDAGYHRRGLRDLPPHPDGAPGPAARTGQGPDGA